MSIIETILNFISSLFGGKKQEQPAEQPKPEPEPKPEPQPQQEPEPVKDNYVEEYIPASDPRVALTNKGRGLVTHVEKDPAISSGGYIVYYANGSNIKLRTFESISFIVQFGIDRALNPHLGYVLGAIKNGTDLSVYDPQEVFDAKVYAGKYEIMK